MKTKEKEILELIKEIGELSDDKAERILAFYQYQQKNLSGDELTDYLTELIEAFNPETNTIEFDNYDEYWILTNEEAEEAVRTEILDTLEYIDPNFLSYYISIKDVEVIEAIQESSNANKIIKRLIEANSNMYEFIEDTKDIHGRGHFIAKYDGIENEEQVNGKYYFIYRLI